MELIAALAVANAEFERRLSLVTADGWHRPTPCTEWNVRALVNHVVGGNRRHAMLLRGASAEQVDATRNQDHLGADAMGAFDLTARELLAEFRSPGALNRLVHHPIGDRSGRELLGMRIVDVTVHAWDLARGIDADLVIDPVLVQRALLEATGRSLQAIAADAAAGVKTGTSASAPQPV